MTGASGFGRFFGSQPDSTASEIPPLLRPPAPPPEAEGTSAPIPFRTGRVLEPPPQRMEPTPVEAETATEVEEPVVEEPVVDTPVVEEPVVETPVVETVEEVVLGPTGRPMPVLPDPRPVTTHGHA